MGNTDNTIAAPTPEDDQTMGVYVNMRDGLAGALVLSANEVTVANAVKIGQTSYNATESLSLITHILMNLQYPLSGLC